MKLDAVPTPPCLTSLMIVETPAHEHRSVSWGDRLLTLNKSADFRSERGHDILELPTGQGMVT